MRAVKQGDLTYERSLYGSHENKSAGCDATNDDIWRSVLCGSDSGYTTKGRANHIPRRWRVATARLTLARE